MIDRRERTLDLLVSRATEGLSDSDDLELDELLNEFVDIDPDGFDQAAAVLDSALRPPFEEMPESLRERIEAEAGQYVGSSGSGRIVPLESHTRREASSSPEARRIVPLRPEEAVSLEAMASRVGPGAGRGESRTSRSVGPWLLVAAAALFAVVGWWPRIRGAEPGLTDVVVFEPTAAQMRQALLAEGTDVLQRDWTATEDNAALGASGDLVWSDDRNEGYMRIAGLSPNDPGVNQYQLWVFDKSRDERYPVDGGVFDVPSSGEVVIPIDAKVHVDEAVLFAITVESPGGVVVSDRSRIVLLAQKG